MARDEIYKELTGDQAFRFDAKVADVFDDMLERSVPCYRQVTEMTGAILGRFLNPDDLIYDLGCSTGTTLLELARRLPQENLRFIGVDNSPAMLEKAGHKSEMFGLSDRISFLAADITTLELAHPGAIILNYTLQFIDPERRQAFLQNLRTSLRPGGVLILSEKTISPDPQLDQTWLDFYLDFKRSNGYSETEIARKRQALEQVLRPCSLEDNLAMLRGAGFSLVEGFSRWFNFVSILAINGKP
jgi:tRNA (cmo5U34)-methyltransferase